MPSIVSGAASFTYTVSDGEKQSIGQVWFFIDGSADLVGTEIDTPRDIPLTQLLANDPVAPGATLSVLRVEAAVNGTAQLDQATGRIRFTPAAGFSGTASFRYVTSDGTQEAASTVIVLVASTSGPVVVQDDLSTMADTVLKSGGSVARKRCEPAGTAAFRGFGRRRHRRNGDAFRDDNPVRAGCRFTGERKLPLYRERWRGHGKRYGDGRYPREPRSRRTPHDRECDEDMPVTLTFDQVLANFNDPDGRTLSISRVDAGPNGTVSVNAAARTITSLALRISSARAALPLSSVTA